MDQFREERLAALRAEISQRLRPVCSHWPEERFEALVRAVADLTFKYDCTDVPLDESATTALIADMTALADRSAEIREQQQ